MLRINFLISKKNRTLNKIIVLLPVTFDNILHMIKIFRVSIYKKLTGNIFSGCVLGRLVFGESLIERALGHHPTCCCSSSSLNTTLIVVYPMGLMRRGLRFFAISLWLLWKWRNEWVFKENDPPLGVKVANLRKLSHEVSATFSRKSIIQGGQ